MGEIDIVFDLEIGVNVVEAVNEGKTEFDMDGDKEIRIILDSLNEGVLEELKDKEDDLDTEEVFVFDVEIELLFELWIFEFVEENDISILFDWEGVLDGVFDNVFVVVGVFVFELVDDTEGETDVGMNVLEPVVELESEFVLEFEGKTPVLEGVFDELCVFVVVGVGVSDGDCVLLADGVSDELITGKVDPVGVLVDVDVSEFDIVLLADKGVGIGVFGNDVDAVIVLEFEIDGVGVNVGDVDIDFVDVAVLVLVGVDVFEKLFEGELVELENIIEFELRIEFWCVVDGVIEFDFEIEFDGVFVLDIDIEIVDVGDGVFVVVLVWLGVRVTVAEGVVVVVVVIDGVGDLEVVGVPELVGVGVIVREIGETEDVSDLVGVIVCVLDGVGDEVKENILVDGRIVLTKKLPPMPPG